MRRKELRKELSLAKQPLERMFTIADSCYRKPRISASVSSGFNYLF